MKNKILLFDLEILPHDVNGLWWDNPSFNFPIEYKITKRSSICTIGYKWFGEKKRHVLSIDAKNPRDDSKILEQFRKVYEEADFVTAHYGLKFDMPFLNGRIYINNLKPFPQPKMIDTYRLCKKHFLFRSSYKLGELTKLRGQGDKLKTDMKLWKDVDAGIQKAIDRMAGYCKRDITLLERHVKSILPYVDTLINRNILKKGTACPSCGSKDTQLRGTDRTKTMLYQRHTCKKCGKWFRGQSIKRSK